MFVRYVYFVMVITLFGFSCFVVYCLLVCICDCVLIVVCFEPGFGVGFWLLVWVWVSCCFCFGFVFVSVGLVVGYYCLVCFLCYYICCLGLDWLVGFD